MTRHSNRPGSNLLSFQKSGSGKKFLLLFHGFGQDHSAFNEWNNHLSSDYTIYSFDLFYHGKSMRPESPLSKREWIGVMDEFLKKEGIQRFSLGAFSLGGRFALITALHFHERVDSMLLTAPDGFYQTRWYRFATHPFTRWIFRHYMRSPTAFDRLLRRMEQLHFVNPSMTKFVKFELSKPENRMRVYRSWVYFRPLLYSQSILNEFFQNIPFPVQIILGEKDRMIRPDCVLKVLLNTQVDIHVLAIRHHELIEPKHLAFYLEKL